MAFNTKIEKINWDNQIRILERFCHKKGYTVVMLKSKNQVSTVCFVEKKIRVNTSLGKESSFYQLLHEIGHIIIGEQHQKYSSKFGYGQREYHARSNIHKVALIEEEYMAWNIGYDLAKAKRLKVNKHKFEKIKSSCLMSYFMWAVKPAINKKIKNALKENDSKGCMN